MVLIGACESLTGLGSSGAAMREGARSRGTRRSCGTSCRCWAVGTTDARICCAAAPRGEQLPPQTSRVTTAGRTAGLMGCLGEAAIRGPAVSDDDTRVVGAEQDGGLWGTPACTGWRRRSSRGGRDPEPVQPARSLSVLVLITISFRSGVQGMPREGDGLDEGPG